MQRDNKRNGYAKNEVETLNCGCWSENCKKNVGHLLFGPVSLNSRLVKKEPRETSSELNLNPNGLHGRSFSRTSLLSGKIN